MKRKLSLVCLLTLLVLAISLFTACGGKNDPENCEHTFGEWQTAVEATCTESGKLTRTCTECDLTEEKTTEAKGHTGGTAKCDALAVCTACNEEYGTYADHVYDVKNTDPLYKAFPANCTDAAAYYYTCACGEKGTETFTYGDPLGHSYITVSNGDGTHSLVCKNDETHTSTVSCSGGTATCIDSAVCDACGEEYGAPLGHSWDNGTAKPDEATDESSFCELGGTMIYTCTECSITKTEIIPPKTHTFVSVITAPTCSEKGYTTHTCSVCDYSYTDTETGATGVHVWDKDRTCTEGHSCTVCSTVEAPLTHVYKVTASVAANCENPATDTYTCSLCGDHYDTVTAPAVGHNIVGVKAEEAIISGCEYSQHFACTRCGEKIRGENVFHHTYSSSISKESTCSTEGVKLVKCSVCDDSYTEAIPSVAGNHVWDNGTSADGRIVYNCTVHGCNGSKSVVDASDKTEVDVKVDDLASSGGVQFEEATLDMSEVTGSLDGEDEVTLSAGTLKDEELEAVKGTLTKDQLAQLGGNSIYNFTMSNSSGLITDFGNNYVTVTIPYQLAEGEDVDSIAIWYMSENELVSIKATYNNGYVTFVTNHFSYYSVTRLTPKERCDLYGHIESRKVVEATCVKEGYTIVLCIRCGHTYNENHVDPLGHNIETVITDPTCTKAGKAEHSCTRCTYKYSEKIPATGHSYEVDIKAATCSGDGYEKGACKCGYTYEIIIPKLPHTFLDTTVEATCESAGYTSHKCSVCQYSYNDNIVNALGHDIEAVWEWHNNNKKAELTLTCKNGCGINETFDVKAVEKVTDPTCYKKGKIEYTVKHVYNGVTYSDTKVEEQDMLEHDLETEWKHNKHGHWHSCRNCSGQSERFEHEFGEGVVTRKATCKTEGEITYACVCGETKTEAIPKTEEHTFKNGKCTVCNMKADCNHNYGEGVVTTAPTCAAEGVMTYTCKHCDGKKTEIIAKTEEHTFSESFITKAPTCTEDGIKTYTCSVCRETKTETLPSLGGHKYDGGAITSVPNCIEDGVKTYTCTVCGSLKTEVIEKTGIHLYGEGTVTTAPTCTEDGVLTSSCIVCNAIKTDPVPSLGGHKWDNGTVSAEPTCTEDGTKTFTCTACKETMTETIPSLGGHKYDEGTVTKSPDCIHDGVKTFTCTVCGSKITETVPKTGVHIYGESTVTKAPTCTEEGTKASSCTVCNNVKTESIPSLGGHKWDNGTVTAEPTCTQDGIKTFTCTVCNSTNTETLPSFGGHKYDDGKITVEPDCIHDGVKTFTCTVCGSKYTEAVSKTGAHTYGEGAVTKAPTCTEDGTKTFTCTVCNDKKTETLPSLGGHKYDEGKVTIEPTCNKEGTKVFTCSVCNDSYDESIPKTDDHVYVDGECSVCHSKPDCKHNYDKGVVTLEPTCAVAGEIMYTCKKCDGKKFETLPKTGEHTYDGGVVTLEPDCVHEGTKTYTCSVCNGTKIEAIPSLGGHKWGEGTVTVEPDCIHDGIETFTCTVCDAKTTESIPKTGKHEFDEGKITTAPECEKDGTKTFTCSVCNYTRTETIENLGGHKYDGGVVTTEPTCVIDGIKTYTCTVCKATKTAAVPNLGGHKYGEGTVKTEPDCIHDGIMAYTCTVCDTVKTESIPKTGDHTYDEGKITTAPECEKDGIKTYTCTVCNTTKTELIPALGGHKWDDGIVTKAPNCVFDGEITYTCTVCKNTKRESVPKTGEHIWDDGTVTTEPNCTYNGVMTYSCTYCGLKRTESIETNGIHTYGEGKVTTAPGCLTEGVMTYNCTVCNVTKTSVIASLGGHVYEGGSCKVCGEEEISCDHSELITHKVDLSEYGACGGYFYYLTCQCGKYTEFEEPFEIDPECNMSEGEQDEWEDEDGTMHVKMSASCADCGLSILIEGDAKKENCKFNVNYYFTVSVKDTEVLPRLHLLASGEDHDYETKTIVISEKCGSTLEAYACRDCGAIREMNDADIECNVAQVSDTFIDENGNKHQVYTLTCSDCGLVLKSEEWAEYLNSCITIYHGYAEAIVDGKVIFSFGQTNKRENHSYETSFEGVGDSCEDGYTVIQYCPDCGVTSTSKRYWHETFLMETIKISELGGCDTTFEIYSCACGREINCNRNMACERESKWEYYTDANGVKHELATYTCRNCGAVETRDTYTVNEGCRLTTYATSALTYGGETLIDDLEYIYTWFYNHSYTYNFILNGSSCKDGYTVNRICKDCGNTESYEESGHHTYPVETYDLAEYGACGGTLTIWKCACGEEGRYEHMNDVCKLSTSSSEEYEIEGILYRNTETRCTKCDLVFNFLDYSIIDGCYELHYRHASVSVGGKVIVPESAFIDGKYERHLFNYVFNMNGTSCEDGFAVDMNCTRCGYTDTQYHSGHVTFNTRYELASYGACDGYLEIYSCPCGNESWYNYNYNCKAECTTQTYTDGFGRIHTQEIYTCTECGLVRIQDTYSVTEGCKITYYATISLSLNGQEIVPEVSLRNGWRYNHKNVYHYDLYGESCEDGVRVSYTCEYCGENGYHEIFHHDSFEIENYNLSDYGACGGTITLYSCPCGENVYLDRSYECDNFTYSDSSTYHDEVGNLHTVSVIRCQTCGLTQQFDRYSIKEDCQITHYVKISVTIGSTVIFSDYEMIDYIESDHKMSYSFDLSGESCNDGYSVNESCTVCDYKNSYFESGHRFYDLYTIDLSSLGCCSDEIIIRQCPCGENKTLVRPKGCEFESERTTYEESGIMHTVYTRTCAKCGLVEIRDSYSKVENCIATTYYVYTYTFGDTMLVENYEHAYSKSNAHDYSYSFEYAGNSCQDGYTEIATCNNCGYTESYEISYHKEYLKNEYDLSSYGACGGYVYIYSCPCGEVQSFNASTECNFKYESDYFVDEYGYNHNVYKYTCTECGLIDMREEYSLKEGCYVNNYVKRTYEIGSTVILDGYNYRTGGYIEHRFVHSFKTSGSCDDGYTVTRTCLGCDYTEQFEAQGHNSYSIEIINLSDYGVCPGSLTISTCPCGYNNYLSYKTSCSFETEFHDYYDKNGLFHSAQTDVCTKCGVVQTFDGYTQKEGCQLVGYITMSYTTKGGTVILDYYTFVDQRYEDHNFIYNFTVKGESCDDGYTVSYNCTDCGYSDYKEGYGHNNYPVEKYDISNYGECCNGAKVIIYRCACGESSWIERQSDCSLYTRWDSYWDNHGTYHQTQTTNCEECGYYEFHDRYDVKEGCQRVHYVSVSVGIGDTTVIDNYVYSDNKSEEHRYDYTFKLYGSSCEDGYSVSAVCLDCGYSYTSEENGHYTYNINSYNLAEYGACGGTVSYTSCACGANGGTSIDLKCSFSYTQNEYDDENGLHWFVYGYTCDTCKLRIQQSHYEVYSKEECRRYYHETLLINVGTAMVDKLEHVNYDNAHDYAIESKLYGESCTDGGELYYTCRNCGYSYTNHFSYHQDYLKETVTLESVCGGVAKIHGCACGYSTRIVLSSALCDFDSKRVDPWIDGIVPSGNYIYDVNYSHYLNNNFYVYTCAVTDPERCAYKYRYASYWVYEGDCTAVRYVQYQFGYNEETGEYDYEISYRTGDSITAHLFTTEDISTKNNDGSYTNGTKKTCERCNSTYTEVIYYDTNGAQVRHERRFFNNLTGETSEIISYRQSITSPFGEDAYEDVALYNYPTHSKIERTGYASHLGYWYEIYRGETYDYLDDSLDSWYNYEYTYNFEAGCVRTQTYSDSNGNSYTNVDSCHIERWQHVSDSTCTQMGLYHVICPVCDKLLREAYTVPYDHYWTNIADEMYYCTRCMLQNANGASGDIVMEDLTVDDGNYTVGYWNRSKVDFTYYVSLMLNTPLADGNDQIVLDGINVTLLDSILYFSVSEVETAANALGYTTDMYDVRFSFVPVGADGSFDYSITFTDKKAPKMIDDTTSFLVFVSEGETVNIEVDTAKLGEWIFTSGSYNDTYASFRFEHADGSADEYYDDDSAGNSQFRLKVTVTESGKATLSIRFLDVSRSGYMIVHCTFVPIEA